MKKALILLLSLFLMMPVLSKAADSGEEDLIIPQADPIYEKFFYMANSGLITSSAPSHFRVAAISTYEAANYVAEAAERIAAARTSGSEDLSKYYKYAKDLREYAVRFYKQLTDMKKDIARMEQILATEDVKAFEETVNEAADEMFEITQEFKKTTFFGVPPFKVMGMLTARWQDIESFGVSHVHHTSLGGTFMQLWTEGIVSQDVSFKLNLTFERPWNEAEKENLPEYWGTGQRFLDKYTIEMKLFNWQVFSGFFWEDITPFMGKQILTERPVLFDRDLYALEETSKGHYENAFLHSFQKRGDIWSKHGWMGAGIKKLDLFGKSQLKLMVGKAEKFDERYDKLYLYEFGGRLMIPFETDFLYDNQVGFNFFNTSNETGEIQTLAPALGSVDYPTKPEGYIQNQNIGGMDIKTNILNLFKVQSEFAYSETNGRVAKPYALELNYVPLPYNQKGQAFFVKGSPTFLPVEVKYQYIAPGYVATASAVLDTADRITKTPTASQPNGGYSWVHIEHHTYAGDPTMLWNNSSRISAFSNLNIPNGFILLNYGTSSQIEPTNNDIYLQHFLYGSRMDGAIWWHLFYSNYGYPVAGRDTGFEEYNNNSYSKYVADYYRATGKDSNGYAHEILTKNWLSNEELIVSDYGKKLPAGFDSLSQSEKDAWFKENWGKKTVKYFNNASFEFRYALSKALGMSNILFLQFFTELATLYNEPSFGVTFGPDTLLSQHVTSGFLIFGLTRKANIMLYAASERWSTGFSIWPVDTIDTAYGIGLDYDFAPRTALFLRAKKFSHDDRVNYIQKDALNRDVVKSNDFDGWQLYAELKNFF